MDNSKPSMPGVKHMNKLIQCMNVYALTPTNIYIYLCIFIYIKKEKYEL